MSERMKLIRSMSMILALLFLASVLFVNIGTLQGGAYYIVEPLNSTGRVGWTLTVSVHVYDVLNLYAYQVRMNWNPAYFELTNYQFGDILADQPDGTTPSSRVSQDGGFVIIGETTNGAYPGVDGDGWLCSVSFMVEVDDVATVFDINNQYTYGLDSALNDITLVKENGNFVPAWPEDMNVDGFIDIFDLATVAINFGKTGGEINPPEADIDGSGEVDIVDLTLVAIKYGQYAGY